jgi:hypothetical protein
MRAGAASPEEDVACGKRRSIRTGSRQRESCGGTPVVSNRALKLKGAEPILSTRKARRLPCRIGETAMLPPIRPPRTGRTQRPGAVAYLALWGDGPQRAFCWGGGRLPRREPTIPVVGTSRFSSRWGVPAGLLPRRWRTVSRPSDRPPVCPPANAETTKGDARRWRCPVDRTGAATQRSSLRPAHGPRDPWPAGWWRTSARVTCAGAAMPSRSRSPPPRQNPERELHLRR